MGPNPFAEQYPPGISTRTRPGNRQFQKKGSRSQNPNSKKDTKKLYDLNSSFGNSNPAQREKPPMRKVGPSRPVPNFV